MWICFSVCYALNFADAMDLYFRAQVDVRRVAKLFKYFFFGNISYSFKNICVLAHYHQTCHRQVKNKRICNLCWYFTFLFFFSCICIVRKQYVSLKFPLFSTTFNSRSIFIFIRCNTIIDIIGNSKIVILYYCYYLDNNRCWRIWRRTKSRSMWYCNVHSPPNLPIQRHIDIIFRIIVFLNVISNWNEWAKTASTASPDLRRLAHLAGISYQSYIFAVLWWLDWFP